MRRAYILCRQYMDYDSLSLLTIGGIQTYITNLIPVLKNNNFTPIIIQYANCDKDTYVENVRLIAVDISKVKINRRPFLIYKRFLEDVQKGDILIYGSEDLIVSKYQGVSIGLQHGISWDITEEKEYNTFGTIKHLVRQGFYAYKAIQRVRRASLFVCVDNNYINWFRTQAKYCEDKFKYIPNFTAVPDEIPQKGDSTINIIFARRFFTYRGTRLFAKAIKRILGEQLNIHVTIAGDGPDENWLRKSLSKYQGVEFCKYESKQSISIHSDKHIAVVPTKGSEGTSLSLLEAMASGCAVIGTNVGGITNIIIDGYNGLLINPNVDELYNALQFLINNNNIREKLARTGYEVVRDAFSHKKWETSWNNLLSEIE